MTHDAMSALLDGECSDAELDRLLDEVSRSAEAGQRWSRLCAARESGTGTRILESQRCICSGVMAALDAAPAAADAKVVDLAARRASVMPGRAAGKLWQPVWKPLVGFAAAASVGAAAVLMVQPQSDAPGRDATTPLPVAGSRLQTASAEPGSPEDAHFRLVRDYVMDHSNSISGEGVGGTLRYARFAAHTAVYRPQMDEQP